VLGIDQVTRKWFFIECQNFKEIITEKGPVASLK